MRQSQRTAEKICADQPNSRLATNNLAWLLLACPKELQDPQRAASLMEGMTPDVPLDSNARNKLALAYYRIGRIEESIELLRKNLADQEDPYLAYDLYFLSMGYWQTGERQRASETLQWADRMFLLKPPERPEIRAELSTFRAEAHELVGTVRISDGK